MGEAEEALWLSVFFKNSRSTRLFLHDSFTNLPLSPHRPHLPNLFPSGPHMLTHPLILDRGGGLFSLTFHKGLWEKKWASVNDERSAFDREATRLWEGNK
jgi:hypothetical protein